MRVANVRKPGNRLFGALQLNGTIGLKSIGPAAVIALMRDAESMAVASSSCWATMWTVAQVLIMNSLRSVFLSPEASISALKILTPGMLVAVDGGAMPADM